MYTISQLSKPYIQQNLIKNMSSSQEKILYERKPETRTLVMWMIAKSIWFAFFCIALYQIPLLNSHKYIITNKKVFVKAGVLSKRQREIPFSMITDVTVSQGVLEQIFGLYRLGIQTAGMGGRSTAVSFLGIADANTPKIIISEHMKK